MKIIGFEEHYTVTSLLEGKLNSAFQSMLDVLQKTGRFGHADQDGGLLAGAFDLGEGRIAAMDAAGIDVQILSCAPGPETVEPPRAVELTTQANDMVQPRSPSIPTGSSALPPCRCATRPLPPPSCSAPWVNSASSAR